MKIIDFLIFLSLQRQKAASPFFRQREPSLCYRSTIAIILTRHCVSSGGSHRRDFSSIAKKRK